MKKPLVFGLLGLLVAAAIALGASVTVFAQDETPTPELTNPGRPGGFMHRGPRMDSTALEAAANALGMTADELSTQLWGGKTLADVAEEQGVELAEVQAAVQAAQAQATRDAIQQAVDEGSMTQEKADWLLEGLDKGFWSGFGRGGHGGFGMGGFGLRPDKGMLDPGADS